jgi:3'(2'), 5'-bisphosphate nucleotidase
MLTSSLIERIKEVVLDAGNSIMRIYNNSSNINFLLKEDKSPLTEADRLSHKILSESLKKILNIPILSEEGKNIPYKERKKWKVFWLIDPLDGTKEFLKKNGEFTVNVALIEKNNPILGFVYAPAKGVIYYGGRNIGALKETDSGSETLNLRNYKKNINTLKVVVSRSHINRETENFLKLLNVPYETMSVGSSLKICYVAEGIADIYPRLGPTMEWDTAAAHAVLKYAGGKLVKYNAGIKTLTELNNLSELTYNKPDLTNPYFIAYNPYTLKEK